MTDPKNLENRLHEKADPARAVSTGRVRYTLAELLGLPIWARIADQLS